MKKYPLIIVAALSVLFSCKKDQTPAPTTTTGMWKGTTALYFAPYININLRSNGTARIFKSINAITDTNSTDVTISEGTYQLKGDTIEANFPTAITFFMGLSFQATINSGKSNMTGTVHDLESEYGSTPSFWGGFILSK
jgi:major membrane immunogen (membrane-anchored lipoprotein)